MLLFVGFVDMLVHLDQYLGAVVQDYGLWAYVILFIIIFMETGFVIMPFLPGDSLLFVAGAIAALGALNPFILFIILSIAAITGDTVNYWIGHHTGSKIFKEERRFLKKEYLERAEHFYEKHGGKTIIIARFVPIIRTFAPFVAGIGRMKYVRFLGYNIIGGISWIAVFIFGGYFFGNFVFVKENFALVILAIIIISLLPVFVGYVRHKRKKSTHAV